MPAIPELTKGLIRSHELVHELRNDIDLAYSALETNRASQYLRRCVVRAISSFIEAAVECVKIELRSTVRTGMYVSMLTSKERQILGPIPLFIPINSKDFVPLEQNVKRTFKLASKIWTLPDFRLSTGTSDFRDFLAAKTTRNRLMHPKTYYDIEVTDNDMRCHTVAGMWLQGEFKRLFAARIRALTSDMSETDKKALLGELAPDFER